MTNKETEEPENHQLDISSIPSNAQRPEDFAVVRGISSGKFLAKVLLGFVPTTDDSEVPALLRYGAWNDCPEAEVHVAACRHWRKTHGAELVAIAGDIVEFDIPRPPKTPEAAAQIAKEQYAYCYDIVDQGTGTIEVLAGSLIDNPRWFFWWD